MKETGLKLFYVATAIVILAIISVLVGRGRTTAAVLDAFSRNFAEIMRNIVLPIGKSSKTEKVATGDAGFQLPAAVIPDLSRFPVLPPRFGAA